MGAGAASQAAISLRAESKPKVARVRRRGDKVVSVNGCQEFTPRGQVSPCLDANRGVHQRLDRTPSVPDHLLSGPSARARNKAHIIAPRIGRPARIAIAAVHVVHAAQVVEMAEIRAARIHGIVAPDLEALMIARAMVTLGDAGTLAGLYAALTGEAAGHADPGCQKDA